MGRNLTHKIIAEHLASGGLEPGEEIALRIDQTLTQDITGTMAFLQFESLAVPRVRTKLSVSYVDHNLLQTGFESADDHRYLQSAAAKYGVHFSRPGNGICHQVHLERFGVPGETLIGSDSHTPTCGGLAMLAMGAGGLDVAAAMAGLPFYLARPKVTLVRLTGELPAWVSAKDVILELLRRLSVKGGVGRVMEYGGPGLAALSVPERATITNMGAELGATSSIFPSDERTREFLRAQRREDSWQALAADDDAEYDEVMELDLSALEPLVAKPHSPDNVAPVAELAGVRVHQVAIGSCTNSSYRDLMLAAAMLEGKRVSPSVSLVIAPGSFQGRCGTRDAQTYLAGVEVCAAAAITGEFTDPRTLGEPVTIAPPAEFLVDDGMIIPPAERPQDIAIVRGPNIAPVPVRGPVEDVIRGKVLLVVGDNITTDDIMPAGAKILPLRSNIPAISQYVFSRLDEDFAARAQAEGGGFIVGGANYGQGSSREHAALAPMALGVRAVLAQSFARIHHANLVNFGLLPLKLPEGAPVTQGDELEIRDVRAGIEAGRPLTVSNLTRKASFEVSYDLTPRQARVLLAGGLLNYIKEGGL